MSASDPFELVVGRAVLRRLREHNNARREAGMRLRTAMKAVSDAHPDLTAREVQQELDYQALGRDEPPSLRAVQWHLQQIRKGQP